MKPAAASLLLLLALSASGQVKKPATLRSILLEQLKTTHNQEDWFVPANVALEGLTPEQASWKDGGVNHSIGQLARHLLFWDRRSLEKLTGQPLAKYSGNNDDTFNSFNVSNWSETVRQLDQVMTAWEKAVEGADDERLAAWASTIEHVSAHNAYHIGQILYVRKQQGSWNPAKGVK